MKNKLNINMEEVVKYLHDEGVEDREIIFSEEQLKKIKKAAKILEENHEKCKDYPEGI